MRKLTSSVTKLKLLLALSVAMLVVCMAGLAFVGGVDRSNVSANALGNKGLKFGPNKIPTDGEGAFSSVDDSSNAVYTKLSVDSGQTDVTHNLPTIGSEVFYALLDKDTRVTATFSVTVSVKNTSYDSATIKVGIALIPNANASEYLFREDKIIYVARSENEFTAEYSVTTVLGYPDQYDQSIKELGDGASFYCEIESEILGSLKIHDADLTLSSETVQQDLDETIGIGLTISGNNRSTVNIDRVEEGSLDGLYVKTGDVITLRMGANATRFAGDSSENVKMDYGSYFNASVGSAGSSCVEWNGVLLNANSMPTNRQCLTRHESQQSILYPEANAQYAENKAIFNGFYASFVVGASSTFGNRIVLTPMFPRGYGKDGNMVYWNDPLPPGEGEVRPYKLYKESIIINIDNAKPVAPILDPTKTLGLAIKNNVWYTESNSFTLDYENGKDSFEGEANEFVYAFVVGSDFNNIIDNNYDFTPDVQGDYSYRTTSGRTGLASRQNAGVFSKTKTLGKEKVNFDNGVCGLVLYAIDSAGNVSSAKVYAFNSTRENVKVDASTRNVGALFRYNTEITIPAKSNLAAYNKYGYTSVCVGPEYHNDKGEFVSKIDYELTDNTNAGQSASAGYIPVKRGMWVTVRVVMLQNNYNDYELVRFHNEIGMTITDPTYSLGRDNCHIFDITFQMTDVVWESTTGDFPIVTTFNRRADLSLNEEEYVYTKKWDNPEVINLEFTAYFAKGDESITIQPEIGVVYYKEVVYYIYANYVKNEYGSIVLTTGGKIEVGGRTYHFDSDEDLTSYIAGRTPFLTADMLGEHQYTAYEKGAPKGLHTDPDTGISYQLYEMHGYDALAGTEEGVVDAGQYFYRAYVKTTGSVPYYGELMGAFEVKKANPGVINLTSVAEITYGQSLSELEFKSTDQDGNVITETSIEIQGKVYQKVASGIFGEYVIESPLPGTEEYEMHNVSADCRIIVKFVPIDVTAFSTEVITTYYDEFFKFYYDRVTDSNGNFLGYVVMPGKQTASNYDAASYEVNVKILHKFAYVTSEGGADVFASYDGTPKEVVPYVYYYDEDNNERVLSDVPMIIEYKLATESDDAYTVNKPEIAGVYSVRMRIDSDKANYTSGTAYVVLTIGQRELEIITTPCTAHKVVEESSEQSYIYNETLTYTYGLEEGAQYTAGYRDEDGTWNGIEGVEFALSFIKLYSYDGAGIAVPCTDESWTDAVTVVSPVYLDAGIYMLRVDVVNVNNAGSKYIKYTVAQARQGDSTKLTVSMPTVNPVYNAITVNGRDQGKLGQLEYGQTMAEVRDIVLGNGGSVRFTPRGTGSQVVPGRFYFETEEDYAIRQGDSSITEVNVHGEAILPVKYDAKTGAIIPYEVKMLWQAGTYDEAGNFIPDYNFRRESFNANVYVVRAKADFSDFSLSTLTYGQRVSEAKFQGTITSHGYVFNESDYTMTVSRDYLDVVPDAGSNMISCKFVPSDELIRRYIMVEDVRVPLTVEKRLVEFDFETKTVGAEDFDGNVYEDAVTFVYGNVYTDPIVTPRANGIDGLDLSSIVPQFSYYRLRTDGEDVEPQDLFVRDGVEYVKIGDISATTPVGKYYVRVEIGGDNGNFRGDAVNVYFVIRATLYYSKGVIPQKEIEYGKNISEVDFGDVTVVNSDTLISSKSFTGKFRLATVTDDGEFNYDAFLEVGENTVYIIFEPDDKKLAEYEANFRPFRHLYTLKVNKRDVSDTIEVTSELKFVYNNEPRSVTAFIPDPKNEGSSLPLKITYSGSDSAPVNAGNYDVVVTVDDIADNYRGSKIFKLEIEKATIEIYDEEVIFAYNESPVEYDKPIQSYVPIEAAQHLEFTYKVEFFKNIADDVPIEAPYMIGGYYANLTLEHENFKANKFVRVCISPVVSGYNGLEQVYSPKNSANPMVEVTPIFDKITRKNGSIVAHPAVNYSVKYKKSSAPDEEDSYSSELPNEAGEYDVCITYDQNGYLKSFTERMVISKATVTFVLQDTYNRVYTSKQIELKVALPGGVTVAHYYYKLPDGTFTSDAPTGAGEYEVRIELEDNNYDGVGYTTLVIEKATLRIEKAPLVSGSIFFSTSKDEVAFTAGTGSVKFGATGEEFNQKGSWAIVDEISNWRVGKHSVRVEFTADDIDNFNVVETRMEIIISKRDISDYIVFKEEIVTDESGRSIIKRDYTSRGISVTPYYTEEAGVLEGYGAVTLTPHYNNMSNAPIEVNTSGYKVGVTVISENYEGSYKGDLYLVISKATPRIKVPTIKGIELNTSISKENAMDHIGIDGYAYIEIGSEKQNVPGIFTIMTDYIGRIYTKANEQPIELLFTPTETNSYNSIVFSTTINVTGSDIEIDWANDVVVEANGAVYGAKLSECTISLVEGKRDLGTIAWVNPDQIPHVGELARYVFTPNDKDDYNIYYGAVATGIAPATLRYGTESSAMLFIGSAIKEAILSLDLVNEQHPDVKVEGCEKRIVGYPDGYDGNMLIEDEATYLGKYIGDSFIIEVTSPDYETGNLVLRVYVVKHVTSFSVGVAQKYYDGDAVSVEDMRIEAEGTNYKLGYDSYRITRIVYGDEEVSEILLPGEYLVTVDIEEKDSDGNAVLGAHSGTHTFTYVIVKTDISTAIEVSAEGDGAGYVTTYGDTGSGITATFGDYEVMPVNVTYVYYSYDKEIYYGSVPPTSAGVYKVIVSVSDKDLRYSGSREFEYTVKKLDIGVVLENEYRTNYGQPFSIVPTFGGTVDKTEVTITYKKNGGSEYPTEITPKDAGTYTVTVTVNNKNLTGTATSTLVISKASLSVEGAVTASTIAYGTALKSSKISGGSVENSSGEEVDGEFVFAEPDKADTPVGENQTVSVVFRPYNKNYADLEVLARITIEKANIGIEFGATEAYYTGNPLTPEVTTDVKVNYSFRNENGSIVSEAKNAGVYTVTVTVSNDEKNYRGSTVVKFTIKKAVAIVSESVLPKPSDVTYGRTLATGYLEGGGVRYVEGQDFVVGSFSYVNSDTVLGNVGTYEGVKIVFTPSDDKNYEPYYATITVKVAKAVAQINPVTCTFVYGQVITRPQFTTAPNGLNVENLDFDYQMFGKLPDAGTYTFTARIVEDNYVGSVDYQVVVLKKTVKIAYYNGDIAVDFYSAPYGSSISAKASILYTEYVGSDAEKSADIEKGIGYRYYDAEGGNESLTPPVNAGSYRVYAVINDTNYTIDREASTIRYDIVKAHVKSITLDTDTLSNQVYGSVVYPKVSTDPVGVGYVMEFPGYGTIMPTSAGNYNIKVTIEDPNYYPDVLPAMFRINPKEISAENLKAYGKPADGLSAIEVTGDLKGVMAGDEVSVTFTATTEDNQTSAGTYKVVILSWELRGLHAKNYVLREPIYRLSATISNRTVYDKKSGAYISSNNGFSNNVTLEVGEVYDTVNQTNFLTSLFGQKASVQAITIKDAGLNTVLSTKVKFYVKIPEAYRNSKTLEIKGRGGLENVTFEKEGDYVTFYADSSGEVLFYTNDFPYWVIIVAGAILIVAVGAILLVFLSPVKRRKRIPLDVRSTYNLGTKLKGTDVKYERKMREKREEQKRRWKY